MIGLHTGPQGRLIFRKGQAAFLQLFPIITIVVEERCLLFP
jgi:hypothetical protein